MTVERLLVDWKTLKAMGWVYSRVHTFRLIAKGEFPQPIKFGTHRSSRIAWRMSEVMPFFE